MANIHRLIVLLFLSFLSFNSFSAISKVQGYRTSTSKSISASSLEDLCSLMVSSSYFHSQYIAPGSTNFSLSVNSCSYPSSSITTYFTLSNGIPSSSNRTVPIDLTTPSCPSNSSPSGSQCTCNEGYEEKNGNSCVLPEPPDPCEGLDQYCETLRNKADEWVVNNKKSPSLLCSKPSVFVPVIGGGASYWDDRFPGCSRGCLMLPGGFSVSYQDDEEKWLTSGTGTYQGSDCSPEDIQDTEDPENPEPQEPELAKKPDPNCPIGHYSGTYNGTKVCLPPKSSSGVTSTEKTNNGDGTTTESKTSVTCANGKCTVTTEKITKNNETKNVVNNVTSTTTVGQPEYCAKNPAAGVCQEKKPSDKEPQIPGTGTGTGSGNGEGEGEGSEFGGSCDSGFTCTGDAIQCAIAKSQHQDSCKLFAPAPAGSVPDGTEEGSAQDLQNKAHVINVQTDLDYSGLGWNRSCPADEDFDIGIAGAKMTIPYSKLCVVLSPMSDITLAITALGLLVWLVAGKKEA